MFVIDHSRSMVSGGMHDTSGNRFRVTRALIDTIYSVYPEAEIGLLLFGPGLTLGADTANDPNLVRFSGVGPSNTDSYMPLLPLNAPVQSGGFTTAENPTAIDLYRDMLITPATGRAGVRRTPARTSGSNRTIVGEQSGTNISIAFKAAVEAFSQTSIPRENQYIIFLSDGEPNPFMCGTGGISNGHATEPACRSIYDFMYGDDVPNIPTTYTVFLNRVGTRDQLPMILDTVSSVPWGTRLAPSNSRTVNTTLYQVLEMSSPSTVPGMIYSIRNNGYSTSNPSSDVWVLQSNFDDMLALMMENIITPMLSRSEGNARSIVISSAGVSDSTAAMDGNFTFNRRLPIDTSEVTPVSMGIRYDVRIDSSFVDPVTGRDTIMTVRTVRDSLFTYEFFVRRSAAASMDELGAQGLNSVCGDKPTLDLLFNNQSLIGEEVRGNMDVLTIRFDNSNGLFDYSRVVVQVMNADSSFTDIENLTLTRGTGANRDIWTVTFPRSVDEVARPNDGRLQHTAQDSIIVVFRNPEIPLDTLRVSVPYVSMTMAFYDAPGNPAGLTALPNAITVTAGDSTNIYARFFDTEGVWDPAMESDPSRITWTVTDAANAAIVTDGAHSIFYSEQAGRVYTVTATYRDGPLEISRSIHITVEPGAAAFLEVLFDTTSVRQRVDAARLGETKEYEFDKDEDRTTFYVVERDAFGNLIGFAAGAYWESNNTQSVTADAMGDASEALITRRGHSFPNDLMVTVRHNGLTTQVHIKVVGESSMAVGPNPFVPGRSDVRDRLHAIDPSGRTYEFYRDIVETSLSGGGGGRNTGVLIAATAPRSIQRNSNGTPRATIVIYDAVGNVVFRSRPNDVVLANDGNTFGFVWDGKNNRGRTVGPGTYLVRMVGTQSDGTRFNSQRHLGVTVEGTMRER
jgi:hypothetical protein